MLLTISLAALGSSQTITASLEGNITDPTGAVIADARVRILNTATNVAASLRTDGASRFLAPSLPPGPYAVTIEAVGFKKAERSGITLPVNQAARLDITLDLGSSAETVEVTAEAPLGNASSAAVGQVVSARNNR